MLTIFAPLRSALRGLRGLLTLGSHGTDSRLPSINSGMHQPGNMKTPLEMNMKQSTAQIKTLLVTTQKLSTVQDFDAIFNADRCCPAFAWPNTEKPSPVMLRLREDFVGMLRLSAALYRGMNDREILSDNLLRFIAEMAEEGYLTNYVVYTTDEKKLGCVIDFWPARLPYHNHIRVPARLADLTAIGAAIARKAV